MTCSRVRNAWLAALLGILLAASSVASEGEGTRNVTTSTFQDRVVATSLHTPVVVEFYADWCGNCRNLRPILDSLAEEYEGRVQFVRIDIDAEPGIAERFGVEGVPTVYLFDAGLPLAGIDGAVSRRQLRQMVEPFASKAQ